MSDILVIGGGLAGGAAAARLASAGRSVQLIERDAEPRHKICGEFLSIEAQRHLAAVGLDVERLGGAPISRLRLVHGARSVHAKLPFSALGLTRMRLDEALLDHALRLGVRIERGVSARSLEGGTVRTTLGDVAPSALLLATGKHDVRGAKRDVAGALTRFVGFKMYFAVDHATRAALAGMIEVILFDGGYAGLQLVEDGVVNLCLLVRDDAFAEVGQSWPALFDRLLEEPHLASRLGAAQPLLPRPITIAAVPYGFVHRARPADAAFYRLGDQAAVIPSFCGDGMSIALHSARLAANAVENDTPARIYHQRLRQDVALQVRAATQLQRLGDWGAGRSAIMAAASLAPSILGVIARWSRVPEGALMRSGLAALT